MSKRKITVGVVTIILLVVGSVWAFRSRTDPQVEKVKQMINEKTPPEQQRQRWEQVRQEMDKLSPEQRDEVRGQMREGFQRRMDEQIKEYFTLPPKDRIAYLDKQINEMEKWRKEREARRAQSGQSGSQGGAGGQQASAGGGGQQGGPGAGRGPARSTDERMQRRDQRLDNSTAQQRAMRSSYMADMRARRIQLGLPPSPFGGGRGR